MGEYDYGAINNNPTYAFNNMLAANAAGATNVGNQLTNSFNNQAALANQSIGLLGSIGAAQAFQRRFRTVNLVDGNRQ